MNRHHAITLAVIALLAIAAPAFAQLDVVTTINGGGPAGQPEDDACVNEGQYAMRTRTQAGVTDEMYVVADQTRGFNNETVVRQLFWFNPRGLTAIHGARHFISTALPTVNGQRPYRLRLFRNNRRDVFQIQLLCGINCRDYPNCGTKGTAKLDLAPNAWNQILVEWAANTVPAPQATDAICRVSIVAGPNAGATAETVLRNNQYSVRGVRLGMQGRTIHTSTDGDHCFDSFESFRTLAP